MKYSLLNSYGNNKSYALPSSGLSLLYRYSTIGLLFKLISEEVLLVVPAPVDPYSQSL